MQKLNTIHRVLLIGLCILILNPINAAERPKIGLVLSGGGAMGFAHIGTLKILDSLQIPIDYFAGTSMGGIAGALYAVGYTGKEIEQIARTVDWQKTFTDKPPRGMSLIFKNRMRKNTSLSSVLKISCRLVPVVRLWARISCYSFQGWCLTMRRYRISTVCRRRSVVWRWI